MTVYLPPHAMQDMADCIMHMAGPAGWLNRSVNLLDMSVTTSALLGWGCLVIQEAEKGSRVATAYLKAIENATLDTSEPSPEHAILLREIECVQTSQGREQFEDTLYYVYALSAETILVVITSLMLCIFVGSTYLSYKVRQQQRRGLS